MLRFADWYTINGYRPISPLKICEADPMMNIRAFVRVLETDLVYRIVRQ